MTTTLENLSIHEPYQGDEDVAIGNGTCLSISNQGSTVMYNSNTPFRLTNILHCPFIAANLLSIKKFCLDNDYWFALTNSLFCE